MASTLYLGGGTPSLMEPAQVGKIIDMAARSYGLAADAEITIETNPGTVTAEKLAGYRRAGVNRLSLGVQSFDDHLLETLGRVHSAAASREAFDLARKSGFANIGIDLIHSLPGQSLAMWHEALGSAIQLGPEHISAYGLTLEEGTPFQVMEQQGLLHLPHEDEGAAMFEATALLLQQAGYEHYEISNFCRPGFRSRHNQVYWQRGSYLGFGAGAHSFLAAPASGERWHNSLTIPAYLDSLTGSNLPEEERQPLSWHEAIAELFFLGLRQLDGIVTNTVTEEFGPEAADIYRETIADLVRQGLLISEGGRLRLAPAALIVSNQVFCRFL
jgi:oxygen-independent coproporphyrinogen-3 oxidase